MRLTGHAVSLVFDTLVVLIITSVSLMALIVLACIISWMLDRRR